MTPQQIRAVQQSWWPLGTHIPAIAAIFELNLTAAHPEFEFRIDGPDSEVGLLVIHTLHDSITALDDPDTAVPLISRLGAALAEADIKPSEYPAMTEAILETMAEVIGHRYSGELADAWEITCDTLAGALQIGASPRCAA